MKLSVWLRLNWLLVLALAVVGTVLFRPPTMDALIAAALGLIKAMPVLAFARAIWQRLPNGLLALSLVLLVYLGFATAQLFIAGPVRWFACLNGLALTALMLASLWEVRQQAKARKTLAAT